MPKRSNRPSPIPPGLRTFRSGAALGEPRILAKHRLQTLHALEIMVEVRVRPGDVEFAILVVVQIDQQVRALPLGDHRPEPVLQA